MNLLQRLEYWGDRHHPKWLDILRIALGIFLCYKGIEFLTNDRMVTNLISNRVSFGDFTLMLLEHYIVFAHIVGGFLLALGLLTRFACLIQIPILLGAIIFVHSSDTLRPYSELLLSIVVLLLLIYFLIVGNGPWSYDWFVNREKR
ncbi:MAG: DoxX family membrane protein [Flavisolibacter sp.]|nr:DoxX family membrane protein [Flavisolibacter sp.]MBD0351246.1 DoxX family membrane protein [Flavisolibacter sp.]MBD0365646.1 DoxX family membrane protein [Flavisolibacter sp.]MBD0377104.1 DoxX family membrane protein [Flavisolibacter sp.]